MQVSVAPLVVNTLRVKLIMADSRNETYWPAVSALVTYRSPAQFKQLPPCTSQTAEAISLAPLSPSQRTFSAGMLAPLLKDCRLDLSSGLPNVTVDTRMPFVTGTLHCFRCQMFYSGSSQTILDNTLHNLQLDSCSFDINITVVTPDIGKNFALAALNSPDKAKVIIGKPS